MDTYDLLQYINPGQWKTMESRDGLWLWKCLRQMLADASRDPREVAGELGRALVQLSPQDACRHACRLVGLALAEAQGRPEPGDAWERLTRLALRGKPRHAVEVNVALVDSSGRGSINYLRLEAWPDGSEAPAPPPREAQEPPLADQALLQSRREVEEPQYDEQLTGAFATAWNACRRHRGNEAKGICVSWQLIKRYGESGPLPLTRAKGDSLGGAAFLGLCRLVMGQEADPRLLVAAATDGHRLVEVEGIEAKIQAVIEYNQAPPDGRPKIDKIVVAAPANPAAGGRSNYQTALDAVIRAGLLGELAVECL